MLRAGAPIANRELTATATGYRFRRGSKPSRPARPSRRRSLPAGFSLFSDRASGTIPDEINWRRTVDGTTIQRVVRAMPADGASGVSCDGELLIRTQLCRDARERARARGWARSQSWGLVDRDPRFALW